MYVNNRIHQNLAQKLQLARGNLDSLKQVTSKFENQCENLANRYATDVVPRKVYDFIKMEKSIKDQ